VKRLMRYWPILAALAVMSASSGCATVKTSNAAVCKIRFDYTDKGVEGLNLQNLRALVAFKEVCDGGK